METYWLDLEDASFVQPVLVLYKLSSGKLIVRNSVRNLEGSWMEELENDKWKVVDGEAIGWTPWPKVRHCT